MAESLEIQLKKTQEKLTQTEEEYQEFAYIISHDLSGPLRSIEGFAAIIAKEYESIFDEKAKINFNRIIKGAEDSKKILASLLEYSRLTTRQNSFVPIDCNTLFEQTKTQLEELIHESLAQITAETLPTILGDQEQLSKVFYHLLHNALLYHQENEKPKINIRFCEHETEWEFIVQDNSIGIKENSTKKVFKALQRAVSNKKYSGMGMGLAISKKIIQRHDGKIWLESMPNKGTTVYFTIAKWLENE